MQTTIILGGKQRPILFNYAAIKAYEQETGESWVNVFADIGTGTPKVITNVGIIYGGLIGANQRVTPDEVFEWTLKLTQKEWEKVYIALFDSMPKPDPETQPEAAGEGAQPGE